ncbi:MAG: glycosyltransferase family 4 protein [Desulfovibrio sp.]|jgi:UDP-glucose:(heptosyl)LPS alpha-1,3-glucosyltransferase|nr:glycosyltransferase family 4 protein [Desulfovibrio sp.]
MTRDARETAPARIALMLPRFSRYGGVEQYGFALAEGLARRGHAVDFLCARREAEAPAGVRVLAVGRPPGGKALKMLWFLVRAERLRRKGGYDLCISLGNTWNQDIVRVGGGPLTVFWRLSLPAWERGPARWGKRISRLLRPSNWLTLLLQRRMFRQTPRVVVISDKMRGWVREVCPDPGAGGRELLTIYNCPDLSHFRAPRPGEREAARRAFGMGAGEYALGTASSNFALKGTAPLIRALSLLDGETHLHVAGGRNAAPYRKLAASLGLADRVHFHGRVADMRAFYHGLDMFVLPTFFDTLGNVVLESLACGLKTLCSDRAGAADFLPPGQVIADPSDPREIADKARRLRAAEAGAPFLPKGSGVGEMIALAERVLAEKSRQGGTDEPGLRPGPRRGA